MTMNEADRPTRATGGGDRPVAAAPYAARGRPCSVRRQTFGPATPGFRFCLVRRLRFGTRGGGNSFI